jgi:hypothetical protein
VLFELSCIFATLGSAFHGREKREKILKEKVKVIVFQAGVEARPYPTGCDGNVDILLRSLTL